MSFVAAFANAERYWQPGAFYDHDEALAGNNPLHYETSATMNGGSETTRYFASGLVRHEGGIIKSTYADKQSLRLNLDQNIGNRCNASPKFNWGPIVVRKDELTRRFRAWGAAKRRQEKDIPTRSRHARRRMR